MLDSQKHRNKLTSSYTRFMPNSPMQKDHNMKLRLPFNSPNRKDQREERLTDRTQKINKKIDLGAIDSSRSNRRLKHCQQMMGAQEQSIDFYMKQLRRREEQYIRKKQQIQNDHTQKVYYLERLLKSQINKNVRFQQELRQLKSQSKLQTSQNKHSLIRSFEKYSDHQITSLFNEVRMEMENRHNQDMGISVIREARGRMSNQLVLSYSKTDESLLLGDVARNF